MVPSRPTFWNIPAWSEILQYLLGAGVVVFIVWVVIRHIRCWRKGTREPVPRLGAEVLKQALERLARFVLTPQRLRSDPYAFITHLGLFWGMVLLALGTAIATIDWDVFHLIFGVRLLQGAFYRVFELVLDVAGVALLIGLVLAVVRRYVLRPSRLTVPQFFGESWESAVILGLLLLVTITGFLIEGLRIQAGLMLKSAAVIANTPENMGEEGVRDATAAAAASVAPWSPVGNLVATIFRGLDASSLRQAHLVLWWIHALAAFAFLLAIPVTKANHLITAFLNVILPSSSELPTASPTIKQRIDGVLPSLTWRQRLEVSACTACGKCQEVCPAHRAGYAFTPKGTVWATRGVLMREVWPWWPATAKASEEHVWLNKDAIWSCYTCRACEVQCPVLVRHTNLVVSYRRPLVDESALADGLQEVLQNLQRYGNSFGQSPRKRADWTKGLPFAVKNANKEAVHYLWFVGDYASYDARAREVTQTIARIFNAAGLDYGILYEKEKNAGNDVRRIGEEGLFEFLRDENLRALESATWQAIVTSDPHSYHVLRNEYGLKKPSPVGPPASTEKPHEAVGKNSNTVASQALADPPGGNGHPAKHNGDAAPLVWHVSELFWELLKSGKLTVAKKLDRRVTYHDPCYLGRYNEVYDAPRAVLEAIGCHVVEMPQHRENSYCCGAGGGRIWMKDRPGIRERPAETRVKEALSLGNVEDLVVACPKDLVMFQDAVKSLGAEDRLRVIDVASLLAQAISPDIKSQD